ncbi:anti-sigma factor family protein [Xylanimonas sp. McL0601]|uniref:anti-sigma factor family protein n=1 Tax=Xylanimonas sp. McL0601 TaxID=3414739 RepID=UPI003CF2237C
MTRTDPFTDWDGAYVLGSLSPTERREFEAHLATCDACRRAVAELAGLPGLLSTLSLEEVEASGWSATDAEGTGAEAARTDTGGPWSGEWSTAQPEGDTGISEVARLADVVPLAGVAAATRRARARRRNGLVAAAAGVAVVAGVAGGVLGGALGPDGGSGVATPPTASATASPTTSSPTTSSPTTVAGARTVELLPPGDSGMHAHLVATPTAWGTRFEWSCRYVLADGESPSVSTYNPTAVTYQLVLVDRAGGRSVAATWTTADPEAEGLGASSALPLEALDRIEITVAGQDSALASARL